MGTINFEKFKQKMEQSKQKKSGPSSSIHWMKFETGKRYTFRFLPLKSEGLELPIAIYHHHSLTFPDGHFESVSCPKKTDEGDCPFCDHATAMYRKFTKTERPEYKEAFKKLVVKTHYLLAGYEPTAIDYSDLKAEDVKVIRASSKANMDLIESKLAKEVDFVDFATGRTVDILKTKGSGKDAFPSITWDFNDPEVAVSGKNGKTTWDDIVDLSPDLTSVIKPLDHDGLMKKFNDFMSAPEVDDEDEDGEDDRNTLAQAAPTINKAAQSSAKPVKAEETDELPFDIDDMKKMLEA